MCGKKAFKKAKRGTLIAFMSAFALFASLSAIESEATSTYYIRTLFDEGSFGLVSQVIPDKGEGKEPLERAKGVDFSSIADYRNVYKGGTKPGDPPGSSLIANIVLNDPTKVDDTYAEVKSGGDKNMGLVFSFPGITQSIDVGEKTKYTALSSDMARAELVGNTLTKGMNDALMFIKTYSGAEHISGQGLRHIVAQLSRITAQFGQSGGADSFNTGKANGGKGFSVIQVTGPDHNITGIPAGRELIPVNGLSYKDYVAITTTNEFGKVVYGYYPWRMAKGYYSTDKNKEGVLEPLVGSEYADIARRKENMYLTWGQLAIQAGVNADLRGSDVSDSASDSMTLIGQGLGADLTSTITSVRSLLNLAPVQELILNMGARSSTHHQGVMTTDMYNTAKTVYVLVLIVSLLFLSVLVVKMIHQKMISTTNIIAKTSLMEGLQDIVFVGVMLAIFPSIFELLLELNYWIVQTFSFSSSYLQAYGISGAKVLSTESLAGFVVSSMFLSIDVYINTTYLVRSIVVSFLFAISPIMTVSYAWGPTQKKLYFSYMRELVGNIFMQSFHAITMTFFAGYNTTNMSSMEAIASTYCFIPITQLFRSLVIGSQGGFSEQLGGKLAGQLTNTATGMHKANVALKQGQQMMKVQADNAKAISDANWSAQKLSMGADLASMTIGKGLEIGGAQLGNIASSKGSKMSGSGGGGSKVGSFLEKNGSGAGRVAGSVIGTGLSVALGSKFNEAGQQKVADAHQTANANLGQMQMHHSMENIGVGLAQAGIGLGVSSYDSGAGNGMISSGMSSVQAGAREYGEGKALSGDAGKTMAEAKGLDSYSKYQGQTVRMAMLNGSRGIEDGLDTWSRDRSAYNSKISKQNLTGINYDEASRAIGMKSTDSNGFGDNAPLEKIEMHNDNTTNATLTFNPNNMKNVENTDSAMANLVTTLSNSNATAQAKADAIEKARQEAGVSRTIDPFVDANGKVQVVVEQLGKNYGIYGDGNDIHVSSSGLKNQFNA